MNAAAFRTEGAGADALVALHEGAEGRAEAGNMGVIGTTGGPDGSGREAAGLQVWSMSGSAHAVNHQGATITTAGDGSGALAAGVLVSGSGTVDAFGALRAENHGTIETSGGVPEGLAPGFGAFGVSASFFKNADSTTIGNAGDVVNTGRVTVSGAQAVGLQAITSGTGTATVTMTGGRVAATRGDDPAHVRPVLRETSCAGTRWAHRRRPRVRSCAASAARRYGQGRKRSQEAIVLVALIDSADGGL